MLCICKYQDKNTVVCRKLSKLAGYVGARQKVRQLCRCRAEILEVMLIQGKNIPLTNNEQKITSFRFDILIDNGLIICDNGSTGKL